MFPPSRRLPLSDLSLGQNFCKTRQNIFKQFFQIQLWQSIICQCQIILDLSNLRIPLEAHCCRDLIMHKTIIRNCRHYVTRINRLAPAMIFKLTQQSRRHLQCLTQYPCIKAVKIKLPRVSAVLTRRMPRQITLPLLLPQKVPNSVLIENLTRNCHQRTEQIKKSANYYKRAKVLNTRPGRWSLM